MKRESNITIMQLGLFENFDRDVMVMQRDEQEVFDDAIHVFYEKEYYDAYVAKATKYGVHRYAYHDDKLGEVVNQVFDENIPGMVFHIPSSADPKGNFLCDEKYISQENLLGFKPVADSYHYLYTVSIDRCSKEEAVAGLWTKNVFVIGTLPDFKLKPQEGEKQVFELMTQRRKNDGTPATEDDYDYESLKVFLTAESAMRFNPDKKPVNKYKLGLLSMILKDKLQIVIEPHRGYWLEYDPAKIDISEHFKVPQLNEERVKQRIRKYANMDKVFILLSPVNSDYKNCVGSPFFIKPDGNNALMYLFEKYEDAVDYVLQNARIFPILDSVYPIGVLEKNNKNTNLNMILAIAKKLGISVINLDMDTMKTIGCKFEFFEQASGYDLDLEKLLDNEALKIICLEDSEGKHYRFPAIPFYNQENSFEVTEEKKEEITSHIDNDFDGGIAYLAGCNIAEMLVYMKAVANRFNEARTEENEEKQQKYNRLMNRVTVSVTECLCEKPYIFTLRKDEEKLALRNDMPFLLVTDRYELSRNGEGIIAPVGIDNVQFMEKLCQTSNAAIMTDGPGMACIVDTRLMSDVSVQWKRSEPLREEIMIYLTQGCDLSYTEALYYYKRLKSDSSIFVEFTSTVRNAGYPPMGLITIEGQNAKDIADKEGLNFLQAYDKLLSLKEKSNTAKTASQDESDQTEEEKKSLFGKLFKK